MITGPGRASTSVSIAPSTAPPMVTSHGGERGRVRGQRRHAPGGGQHRGHVDPAGQDEHDKGDDRAGQEPESLTQREDQRDGQQDVQSRLIDERECRQPAVPEDRVAEKPQRPIREDDAGAEMHPPLRGVVERPHPARIEPLGGVAEASHSRPPAQPAPLSTSSNRRPSAPGHRARTTNHVLGWSGPPGHSCDSAVRGAPAAPSWPRSVPPRDRPRPAAVITRPSYRRGPGQPPVGIAPEVRAQSAKAAIEVASESAPGSSAS